MFAMEFVQTSCIWGGFQFHLLWNSFLMMTMLLWIPCMAWPVLLLHLWLFLSLLFFLLPYISPVFLEYCCPHICCLLLYIGPIHQPTSSRFGKPICPCCFELDIKGLPIFGWYLWHLWLGCWCLLLKLNLLPLLSLC